MVHSAEGNALLTSCAKLHFRCHKVTICERRVSTCAAVAKRARQVLDAAHPDGRSTADRYYFLTIDGSTTEGRRGSSQDCIAELHAVPHAMALINGDKETVASWAFRLESPPGGKASFTFSRVLASDK
jgi:hypothetical protein